MDADESEHDGTRRANEADAPASSRLAERFAGQESGAFEEVVTAYQAQVGRLAQRLLGWGGGGDVVPDIVQDVFLIALRKAPTFRGGSSLWTWLTAITLNLCRSHLRRRAVARRVRRVLRLSPAPEAPSADDSALGGEAAAQVRRAVAALPSPEREVVVLYYLEQRPVAEIAELLGASPNAVQVRMYRARQQLKASLAEFAPAEGAAGGAGPGRTGAENDRPNR